MDSKELLNVGDFDEAIEDFSLEIGDLTEDEEDTKTSFLEEGNLMVNMHE